MKNPYWVWRWSITREYYLAHQEELKRKAAEYRASHQKQTMASNAAYRISHQKEMRERSAAYMAAHKEEQAAYSREYWASHKEEHAAKCKRWTVNHPEDRRVSHGKSKAKHRLLGCALLNTPFEGSEGHHLDRDRVLHIPAELHKSVRHDVWTGKNMEQVNALAFQWLEQAARRV
jgi:hypothetical protein